MPHSFTLSGFLSVEASVLRSHLCLWFFKTFSNQVTKEIIEKHDHAVHIVVLVEQYESSTSAICTLLKQKESMCSGRLEWIDGILLNFNGETLFGI